MYIYIYIYVYMYIYLYHIQRSCITLYLHFLYSVYMYTIHIYKIYTYTYIYMHRKISDSRPTQIHVMAFKCEGLQGSNIRPSESFFRALRKKMSYLRKVRGNLLF